MTDVSTINSSSSVNNYLESTPKNELNPREIFKKLSIDLGEDGKTITKDKLDSYVAKAEKAKAGKEDTSGISDEELASLTALQDKWNTIADGGDSITFANMSKNKDILTSMDKPDAKPTVDPNQFKNDTADVYAYIMESALATSTNSNGQSGAQSLLNTLLTGNTDVNDDSNANMIAKLTNLIAESKATSTVDTKA